jgi:macrodomain Ter protein organizer (MatP/YcbG family)
MDDLDGAFGMILGAAVTALRKMGHSPEAIHQWVDAAIVSADAYARVAQAAKDE